MPEEAQSSVVETLGGEQHVKEMLTKAIASARRKAKLSCDDVDRLCRFGKYYSRPHDLPRPPHLKGVKRQTRELPAWEKIEGQPILMRGDIFGVASLALDVPLDRAIDQDALKTLEEQWAKKDPPLRVLFGCAIHPGLITKKDRIPVYLLMRVLREIS